MLFVFISFQICIIFERISNFSNIFFKSCVTRWIYMYVFRTVKEFGKSVEI